MAQKIVTIEINPQADGTASIVLSPEEIFLAEGDTLAFQTLIAPELTEQNPRVVFKGGTPPFAVPGAELQSQTSLSPQSPMAGREMQPLAEDAFPVNGEMATGEHFYTVELPGANSLSGRIKIIRQQ